MVGVGRKIGDEGRHTISRLRSIHGAQRLCISVFLELALALLILNLPSCIPSLAQLSSRAIEAQKCIGIATRTQESIAAAHNELLLRCGSHCSVLWWLLCRRKII